MVLLTDAPSDLALPQQREKHLTILYKYKDAFLQDDVLAMLMQLVADPLSREGTAFSLLMHTLMAPGRAREDGR